MLVLALILIAVLVVAAVGGVWAVRMERRSPTSYTRSPGTDLAWWALLPADEQEAVDEAAWMRRSRPSWTPGRMRGRRPSSWRTARRRTPCSTRSPPLLYPNPTAPSLEER
jgi:hypothetical protein